MTPLTGQNIIDKFETYTGDTSELSSEDELDLANKIYRAVCNDRPWEWLKKTATGIVGVSNGIATASVPSDFKYFVENDQATDIAQGVHNNASPKVIFLATTSGYFHAYQIVNFSDRRQFLNQAGYAYFDAVNNQIVFTAIPTETDLSYEFDYICSPAPLTTNSSPVFHADYHDIIFHGMVLDDLAIQLFDRTHSYQAENLKSYTDLLSQLRYQNAQLQMQ